VPELLRVIHAYGGDVAQDARAEILQNVADWASPGIDELVVIQKMGIYCAVTATFGLYKSRSVISEEGTQGDGTTFGGNWDNVPTVNLVLKGGQKLKCFMTDSAADPLGITFAIMGKVYKISELRRR